jgi:hypothetical protein
MENYPIFNSYYLIETPSVIVNDFNKYLNYTNDIVNKMQNQTNNYNEIPLSFYPIAKNIRMTSSYMTMNILNGYSSYIDNMARSGEPDFWKNNKKMGDWYPWLWSRGFEGNFEKNIDGWKIYFDSFIKNRPSSNLEIVGDSIEPPEHLFIFFLYLSSLQYSFHFNNKYQEKFSLFEKEMNWPNNSKILAVQIRRGETCMKDGSISDRPFYHLEEYIKNIDKMISTNGFEYIYISTDSDEEISELKKLRPEWKLLYIPIDRTQFFRMKNGFVDLEVFCTLEPNRIPFIVDSGLADLYFISQCQGYISTISVSEFSRCGWFLQIARQRKITPYINMNNEELDMSKKDTLLLL